MRHALLGLAALATATVSQAAIQINFNNPSGDLGSNSHTYINGAYSVTATGYSNFNFGTNSGTANNLYGKSDGGDENGVGLLGDPSGLPNSQHEIWYGFGKTTPAIILNVSGLTTIASAAQFMMGSTTSNEQWIIEGYNGTSWTQVLTGMTQLTLTSLPSWGTYSKYAIVSGGTVTDGVPTSGNVLLSAISLTPSVPEPGTWALMLIGFGGIGIALRRSRKQDAALRQLA